MNICKTKQELKDAIAAAKLNKQSIGFIPTMGAIHIGHTSLVEIAKSQNSLIVCSIFVNPTQFNDRKDLLKYPRPIENDIKMLENAGCDLLFLPSENEMYGFGETWDHSFGELAARWEGASRPGHFNGVGQIVYKLFDLVQADKAYFGQKDFQQTLVVKKLVDDFSLKTEIVVCPILRESDGLAMSSRNIRLSELERVEALKIYQALNDCKTRFLQGEATSTIIQAAEKTLNSIPNVKIEYCAIVNQEDLGEWSYSLSSKAPVAIIAIQLPSVRLIDNMILE